MSEPAYDPTTAKAYPSRFEVSRVGQPDPRATRYLVLDVVHDYEARVAAAKYASGLRSYGSTEKAQEVESFLDASKEAHEAFCQERNGVAAKLAKKGKKISPTLA